MLQTISVQILDKGKVTKLNYKVWAGFGILEKELVAGPHVSGTNCLTERAGCLILISCPALASPGSHLHRRRLASEAVPQECYHAIANPCLCSSSSRRV
jgi:hypothetical protein